MRFHMSIFLLRNSDAFIVTHSHPFQFPTYKICLVSFRLELTESLNADYEPDNFTFYLPFSSMKFSLQSGVTRACLSFRYHIFGADTGDLEIRVSSKLVWREGFYSVPEWQETGIVLDLTDSQDVSRTI